MNVNHFLKKENNNFDLLRLILAFLVIYGHAEYLNRGDSGMWWDPFLSMYPESSFGDIAVKCFFFLSGLLITASLKRNASVSNYFISRIFRIMPPLIFVLFANTFLFGPFISTLSTAEYFSNSQTWTYFIYGSLLKIQYVLPGVFSGLEHNAVNGSLWTLPWEFRFYLYLLSFSILVGLKRIWLANIILGILLLDSLLGQQILIKSFGNISIINLLPLSFFFGVFVAINSDRLNLNFRYVLALFFIFYLFKNQPYGEQLFTIFFCAAAFLFATTPRLLKLKPPIDISYGVYLWGYFVQQCLFYYFGTINVLLHTFLAFGISILLATLTHYLIEKPFMKWGKKISKGFSEKLIIR